MRKDIQRRQDAHVRTHAVCTEHSALFDATPGGQQTRQALSASVTDVARLLGLQERSREDRRAATEQCRRERRALRDAVNFVINVGKLVHLDDIVMDTMQLPRPRSNDQLLAYARGLLDRVSPHADAFVAGGLSPDLLKNLADAIGRFDAARDVRTASRLRYTAATRTIRANLDETDKAIAVLESLAANTPAGHPEVVTKLRIAKRVGPRVAAPPGATSSPPAAAPPATPIDKAA